MWVLGRSRVRTIRNVYGAGSPTVSPTSFFWSACISMYRHIYDWNIVDCDVKQPIHLTSPSRSCSCFQFVKSKKLTCVGTDILTEMLQQSLRWGKAKKSNRRNCLFLLFRFCNKTQIHFLSGLSLSALFTNTLQRLTKAYIWTNYQPSLSSGTDASLNLLTEQLWLHSAIYSHIITNVSGNWLYSWKALKLKP